MVTVTSVTCAGSRGEVVRTHQGWASPGGQHWGKTSQHPARVEEATAALG